MRFRWDWLSPVVTVPYVPTLGPVHPAGLGPQLFADVIDVAGTGRFLPYDKDRRWSDAKDETVLPLDVVHRPAQTLVPTLIRRGAGTIKVHLYGEQPGGLADAAELAAKLAAAHGVAAARVVSFEPPGQPTRTATRACTRVQLCEFTPGQHPTDPDPAVDVQPLESHSEAVRTTFADFSEKLSGVGFAFLHSRMRVGRVGPVLVTVTGGRVSGAIGPMETMADHRGQPRLLPQYFAVLPDCRGHGYGRALWRAAMHWGRVNGAGYQLLQTEVGGASDVLCQSEGLTDLGLVHNTAA